MSNCIIIIIIIIIVTLKYVNIKQMKNYHYIDLMVVDLVVVFYLACVNSNFELRFMFYEPSNLTILHLSC
jgi:hypothetical protein